jgi:hypothetical protein
MGLLDAIVGQAFRDDKVGRVVVFNGDRRNRGYVVRSEADELRIKSFLKMFYFAHFSILLLGIMLANAWATFVIHLDALGKPAAHLLRSEAIFLAIYCLVVGLPYLLLWRTYKQALPTLVSAQDAVPVSGGLSIRQRLVKQRALIVLGLATVAIGLLLAIMWLIRFK